MTVLLHPTELCLMDKNLENLGSESSNSLFLINACPQCYSVVVASVTVLNLEYKVSAWFSATFSQV